MRHSLWMLVLACLLWLVQVPLHADNSDWSTLDTGTRALLATWSGSWNTLDMASRTQLLANAKRWQAMDANARNAFLQRSLAWQALPPLERARRRARYAAWHGLAPDIQSQLRVAAARFAALPTAQQTDLRARFTALDGDQQQAWLLGPSMGGWIGQARSLFAYVPEDEREATLRMLESLSPDARSALFARAAKLPNAQREQLREKLLDVDPAQREVLLQQGKPR